jgi:hypothetical protein
MAWYTTLFQPLFGTIGDYFTTKQKIKANKVEYEFKLEEAKFKAQAARIERGDLVESDYDKIVLEQAKTSFADELMIIWILGLVTTLFIPELAPYAREGFSNLEQVPVYIQLVFVGAFISKLGLRFLFSGRTLFGKTVK